jgi:predicted Zn-dependent protease
MHPSQTPQSIDEKDVEFCQECRNDFRAASPPAARP